MHVVGLSPGDAVFRHAVDLGAASVIVVGYSAKPEGRAALAKALKRHGFVFVGPTTAYAAMQACGLVDDHVRGCHRARG